MSTQINLTIGDQRLLQDNKTRAAANQQALDDRTASKQLEQEATQAAQTAAPERLPGAVPETNIPRRPAAQRRPADKEVAFTTYRYARFLATSTFTAGATQPQWTVIRPGIENVNGVINSIDLISTTYDRFDYSLQRYQAPEFIYKWNTDTNTFMSATAVPALSYDNQIRTLNWPTRIVVSRPIIVNPTRTNDGPAFPIASFNGPWIVSYVSISTTASDIYYSALYSYNAYTSGSKISNNYKPIPYFPSITDERADVTFAAPASTATVYEVAYYVKYNKNTLDYEYRVENMLTANITGVQNISTPPGPQTSAQTFIQAMYNTDPRKIWYAETNNNIAASDVIPAVVYYDPESGKLALTVKNTIIKKVGIYAGVVNKKDTYNNVYNSVRTLYLTLKTTQVQYPTTVYTEKGHPLTLVKTFDDTQISGTYRYEYEYFTSINT